MRFDDPHGQLADPGQERAIIQPGQHRQPAAGAQPDQELGAGGGDLGQERGGVEAPVGQHQHVRPQQVQQLAGVIGLAGGGRPEHRAEQRPGAGLHQGHQLHRRVAGDPERGFHLPQPAAVTPGVGHLDGGAAVEGHRPVPAEPHPRGARLRHRPGQHLKQLHQRTGLTRATRPKRHTPSAFAGTIRARYCAPVHRGARPRAQAAADRRRDRRPGKRKAARPAAPCSGTR